MGTQDKLDNEKALTAQEEAFCQAFGNPESETFGKQEASAEAAGYSGARTAAWRCMRRPRVKKRLQEIYDASEFSVGRILTNLLHDRKLAEAKGDISAMVRADELCGKHLRMFVERQEINARDDEPMTDEEEAYHREYAAWRLDQEALKNRPPNIQTFRSN